MSKWPEGFDVTEDLAHGCWLWRGSVAATRRPEVVVDGVRQSAWRAAWRHAGNEILPGYSIVPCEHSRVCVNPEHLMCLPHPQAVSTANKRAWARRRTAVSTR